jgi:hypothetical protein
LVLGVPVYVRTVLAPAGGTKSPDDEAGAEMLHDTLGMSLRHCTTTVGWPL